MKKLAEFVVQGFNESELQEQIMEHNIFQVKSESRKREIASTILTRFKVLDNYLIKKLTTSDVQTCKIIVLYAIIKTDRLFFEFMFEVFHEKKIIQDFTITDWDYNAFFENKRHQSERVSSWSEYTFYKLRQVYNRILFEAGLLENHEIKVPIINQDVLEYLRQLDDSAYINVIVGGESSRDRKSTRLNSSHVAISYAVFCLKKKRKTKTRNMTL